MVPIHAIENESYPLNLFAYYPVKNQSRQDHSSYLYPLLYVGNMFLPCLKKRSRVNKVDDGKSLGNNAFRIFIYSFIHKYLGALFRASVQA